MKVFISQAVYDAAKQAGVDMTRYAVQEKIPLSTVVIEHPQMSSADRCAAIEARVKAGLPLGASHVTEFKPGAVAVGSLSYRSDYAAPRKAADVLAAMPPARQAKIAARARQLRKHIPERQACSGKDCLCLAGLGGKCVICGTGE
jgi:hypothetical protein